MGSEKVWVWKVFNLERSDPEQTVSKQRVLFESAVVSLPGNFT